MHKRLFVILIAAAAAVGAACSSSTGPGVPTFAGSWRVATSPFYLGFVDSLVPDPFTITFSAGQGDTLTVSMPRVWVWVGSAATPADSVFKIALPKGDTLLVVEKDTAGGGAGYLALRGIANARRDSMTGTIGLLDLGFSILDTATFVATKR
ncbi:MAG TPA: hypothetical protein VFL67_04090 [Mycobacterium sp.]|nr:hypothetical protein [Mycobacterium sp.]HET7789638.1 hypothetical protein [Gemmatimonadales bacterium]